VFVVVFAVRGVPAPVVHVVDMVSVRHGHMTTPVTVNVVMIFVHGVAGRSAFVVVTVVQSMKVTVVHVVDMVPMRDRHMAASSAVDVVMINMLAVSCGGHRFSPPFRVISTRKSLAGRNLLQTCRAEHPWLGDCEALEDTHARGGAGAYGLSATDASAV
jgi:hypothetical protein